MRFNTSILLSLLALETLAAPAPQADVSDVVISAPASASTAATTGVKGGCKAKIGGSLFGVNRGHRRPHSRPSGNADAPAPSGDAEPATPAPSSGSEVPADIPSPSPSAEETPAPSPSPVESDIPMPSDQAPAPAPAAESTATEVQHVNEGVTVIIGDARPTQDTAPNVSAPNPVQSEQAPPPAQSPAPAAPASGGSGSDDGNGSSFDGFAEAMLKGHNDYRASYNGAVALVWNQSIADQGMNHYKDRNCVMEHSHMDGLGENLAKNHQSVVSAVNAWGPEEAVLWTSGMGFTNETGHFTQLVWKDTTSVGCGRTECGSENLIFCEYFPAGNVNMQGDPDYFTQRVVRS